MTIKDIKIEQRIKEIEQDFRDDSISDFNLVINELNELKENIKDKVLVDKLNELKKDLKEMKALKEAQVIVRTELKKIKEWEINKIMENLNNMRK